MRAQAYQEMPSQGKVCVCFERKIHLTLEEILGPGGTFIGKYKLDNDPIRKCDGVMCIADIELPSEATDKIEEFLNNGDRINNQTDVLRKF